MNGWWLFTGSYSGAHCEHTNNGDETNLYQLLFELLDLRDVEFAQQVVHEAGDRAEQLVHPGRGAAVAFSDRVGQFDEAVLVPLQSLVVVGLGAGIVTELEAVQRDAQWAEGKWVNNVLWSVK